MLPEYPTIETKPGPPTPNHRSECRRSRSQRPQRHAIHFYGFQKSGDSHRQSSVGLPRRHAIHLYGFSTVEGSHGSLLWLSKPGRQSTRFISMVLHKVRMGMVHFCGFPRLRLTSDYSKNIDVKQAPLQITDVNAANPGQSALRGTPTHCYGFAKGEDSHWRSSSGPPQRHAIHLYGCSIGEGSNGPLLWFSNNQDGIFQPEPQK